MIIEDGKGRGYKAGVSDENRLLVDSVRETEEHHANQYHGEAYHLLFSQTPTAGDDCILYLVNLSNIDMIVEGVTLHVSGACDVYIKLNDKGTRNSASALTPANVNAGSGRNADGTFEKGADLDGGAATLAGGTEVWRWTWEAVRDSQHFNFEMDIIIPKNSTLTLWCNAIATVTGMLPFYYHAD